MIKKVSGLFLIYFLFIGCNMCNVCEFQDSSVYRYSLCPVSNVSQSEFMESFFSFYQRIFKKKKLVVIRLYNEQRVSQLRRQEVKVMLALHKYLRNMELGSLVMEFPEAVYMKSSQLDDHYTDKMINTIVDKAKGSCLLGKNTQMLIITDFPIHCYGQAVEYNVAIVSSYKFERDYSVQDNFITRLSKVIKHELGHLAGLPHCRNPQCVMHSAGLKGIDTKGINLCAACKKILTHLRINQTIKLSKNYEYIAQAI